MSSQRSNNSEIGVRVNEAGDVIFDATSVPESPQVTVSGGDWRSSQSAGDSSYHARSSSASESTDQGSSPVKLNEDDLAGVVARNRVDEVRQMCQAGSRSGTQRSASTETGPSLAKRVLAKIKTTTFQWCTLANLQPTKLGGYPQASWEGANKFATVGEVVIWSKGQAKLQHPDPKVGDEVSHLCTQPRCMDPDHIILESKVDNNSRKGCVVYTPCSADCRRCNGRRVVALCPHSPPCIMHHPGYKSLEDFQRNGICRDDSEGVRERDAKRRRGAEVGLKPKGERS